MCRVFPSTNTNIQSKRPKQELENLEKKNFALDLDLLKITECEFFFFL